MERAGAPGSKSFNFYASIKRYLIMTKQFKNAPTIDARVRASRAISDLVVSLRKQSTAVLAVKQCKFSHHHCASYSFVLFI